MRRGKQMKKKLLSPEEARRLNLIACSMDDVEREQVNKNFVERIAAIQANCRHKFVRGECKCGKATPARLKKYF